MADEPHYCHVRPFCKVEVPERMLMCAPHWRMVPAPLRRDVLKHYRPGQERLKVMPSKEWFTAARNAVDAVLVKLVERGEIDARALSRVRRPSGAPQPLPLDAGMAPDADSDRRTP